MGADMTEGTIVKWLKNEGDKVSKGDKLAEIETDKTVVEMEAYDEGFLRKITSIEGSVVQVGKIIGYIGDMDEDCLLYTTPSPRDRQKSSMASSA